MSAFARWYEEAFGAACPVAMRPLEERSSGFFRSEDHPALVPAGLVLPCFVEGIARYEAAGLAALGPQTTYFVLTRVDDGRQHYFRLPFDGVYVDPAARAQIHAFLVAYAAFEARFAPRLSRSRLLYSTGHVEVSLAHEDGRDVRVDALPLGARGAQPAPSSLFALLEARLA